MKSIYFLHNYYFLIGLLLITVRAHLQSCHMGDIRAEKKKVKLRLTKDSLCFNLSYSIRFYIRDLNAVLSCICVTPTDYLWPLQQTAVLKRPGQCVAGVLIGIHAAADSAALCLEVPCR